MWTPYPRTAIAHPVDVLCHGATIVFFAGPARKKYSPAHTQVDRLSHIQPTLHPMVDTLYHAANRAAIASLRWTFVTNMIRHECDTDNLIPGTQVVNSSFSEVI